MSNEHLSVHDVDPSGALAEAAEPIAADPALHEAAVRGDTRAQLLRKAAMGGAGLMGGGMLLGLASTGTGAPSPRQDREILNFALTLEYLEAAFYAEALQRAGLSGEALTFARTAGAHEQAHVDFLRGALGSAAVASPRFDFKGTTGGQDIFLRTAVTLEDTGVAAYIGQAYRIQNRRTILIASHVLAVEARHAAWVRGLAPGRIPSDDAFNNSTFDNNGVPRGGYATMPQVLRVASQFIV